jgi:hypothetical protein
MTDPLSVATLSLQILSRTTEALNALRERAQRSKDLDIKNQINALYDSGLAHLYVHSGTKACRFLRKPWNVVVGPPNQC